MENLFPSKNISFDYDHGVYYPTVEGHRKVNVKCEDKTLLHWTLNALNRHGYQCTFAPQADLPTLEAISANELKWTEEGTTQVFTSFEGLLGSL